MSTILHALTQLASTEVTDEQLLGRYVATRDSVAFEALVRRHGPMVLGVCRRLLPNLHDAAGRTKPIVTSAANAAPRVRMPSEPRAYLYHPTLSLSLKPGEVFELGTARLRIQAASENGAVETPALIATPGKYQVVYPGLAFAGTAGPGKVWVTTGKVHIEVRDANRQYSSGPSRD